MRRSLGGVIDHFIATNGKGLDSGNKLAEHCGISTGYLAALRKGINPRTGQELDPSVGMLRKLAKGMDMSLEKLLFLAGLVEEEGVDITEEMPREYKLILKELGLDYLLVTKEAYLNGITPAMLRGLLEAVIKMK